MASFRFGLQPLKNGTVLIRATMQDPATNAGKPLYCSTTYTIPGGKLHGEYKHWDKKKQRVRNTDDASTINSRLSEWLNKWDDYLKECTFYKTSVNITAFRNALDASKKTGDISLPAVTVPMGTPETLLQLANEYYIYAKETLRIGTHKQYKTCIEDITGYQNLYGPVMLNDVNKEFYRKYGLYLIENANNYNNTVNRKIGRIVTLMNYATAPERKYTKSVDYKAKYKFNPSVASRFPLLPAEIKALKAAKVDNPNDELILDAFRFACETTLRFSDVTQLRPAHKTERVVAGQTIHILDLTQVKTSHANSIALSDYALSLWNKYATGNKYRLFPIQHPQTANDRLKEIFEHNVKLTRMVEIVRTKGSNTEREVLPLYKVISFHMSRNTAITFQLAHLSPAVVMQNAGIKKLETVLRYNRDDEERRMLETLQIQNKKPSKRR